MTFVSTPDFRHDTPECLGVLLANLGTPDAPSVPAVRRYLAEFLADPRVVELPRALWLPILHAVILRVRPARSAKAYRAVWAEDGSPLLSIARRQAAAVQTRLSERFVGPVKVALGMRYGNPSIPAALAELRQANARRVLVFPLYPQYSGSTTASVFDAVTRELQRWRWLPELRFINQYHDEPAYIDAVAESIRNHWAEQGEPERLLFSFHGIPKDYFENGDPYFCHCQKTARLVTDRLGLPSDRWALTFQSRVGFKEWLKPYTDETLKAWGAEGVRSVQVLSPGFSADCLETIEEIDEENRGYFLGAGGKEFSYIHCLNDAASHIEMLAGLVERHAAGWPEVTQVAADNAALAARHGRAVALGAAA
ncbi:MAG: ferrochelatase [Thiocapsa sp.]|uniref:ferrochelatase n=1 Tax=Thiocapsa sp. TaxID=2024551 RepID=UPI001BCD7B42|nr:ferrochelatase [Thiocapsa sp.]QVL51048.1 MAG: ferrochelatase [Thiocapsa sp.]